MARDTKTIAIVSQVMNLLMNSQEGVTVADLNAILKKDPELCPEGMTSHAFYHRILRALSQLESDGFARKHDVLWYYDAKKARSFAIKRSKEIVEEVQAQQKEAVSKFFETFPWIGKDREVAIAFKKTVAKGPKKKAPTAGSALDKFDKITKR